MNESFYERCIRFIDEAMRRKKREMLMERYRQFVNRNDIKEGDDL